MKRKLHILALGVALIPALALAGCHGQDGAKAAGKTGEAAKRSAVPSPTPTPTDPPGTKRYTTRDGAFSFTYPQEWTLKEEPARDQVVDSQLAGKRTTPLPPVHTVTLHDSVTGIDGTFTVGTPEHMIPLVDVGVFNLVKAEAAGEVGQLNDDDTKVATTYMNDVSSGTQFAAVGLHAGKSTAVMASPEDQSVKSFPDSEFAVPVNKAGYYVDLHVLAPLPHQAGAGVAQRPSAAQMKQKIADFEKTKQYQQMRQTVASLHFDPSKVQPASCFITDTHMQPQSKYVVVQHDGLKCEDSAKYLAALREFDKTPDASGWSGSAGATLPAKFGAKFGLPKGESISCYFRDYDPAPGQAPHYPCRIFQGDEKPGKQPTATFTLAPAFALKPHELP